MGSLCEHEDRVGAAKTANRFISFMSLRGSTHVLCIVQTAAVIAWMYAFEDKGCLHVGARALHMLAGRSVRNLYVSCLFS